jgi:hypothetical protein
MRFLSVLFAGGVAASLCLTSFSQTADQSSQTQQQAAPATQSPSSNGSTPQLKLENLPPDPRTPTAEEEAAQAAERQRAQIARVATSMANWGPKASSPGITLTMKETGREKAALGTLITYRLASTGFAPGTRLTLLRWPLNQGVTAVMNGIVIDASGTAVCGSPAPAVSAPPPPSPDEGKTAADAQAARQNAAPSVPACTKTMQANAPVEIMTAAAKGEAIRVALVAEDRKGGAAASVVPYPLTGADRGCKLQVLLGAKDGELVLIEGEGFKPDVPFTMGAETFGQKASIGAKPDAQGHFVAAMTPYVQGHDSGDTVVYYQSDPCTPTVSFHWGKGTYKVE